MDIDRCINQYNTAVRNGNKPRNLDWEKVARHILRLAVIVLYMRGLKKIGIARLVLYMTMVKLFIKMHIPLVYGEHQLLRCM